METHGFHLLLDVWLDEALTREVSDRLAAYVRGRFTVVAEAAKEFQPVGLTQVLVLSESHFSIHTYPEHRYLSVDLYICRPDEDLDLVRDELLALMRVRHYRSSTHRRGILDDAAVRAERPLEAL